MQDAARQWARDAVASRFNASQVGQAALGAAGLDNQHAFLAVAVSVAICAAVVAATLLCMCYCTPCGCAARCAAKGLCCLPRCLCGCCCRRRRRAKKRRQRAARV